MSQPDWRSGLRVNFQLLITRSHPALVKPALAIHIFLYRATNGLVGGRLWGMPVLLLTTLGRKSGQPRTTALNYVLYEHNPIVITSNSGWDKPPAWWSNLKNNPNATVQMGREIRAISARAATPEEQERLWPLVLKSNPSYAAYQTYTRRELTLVILRPENSLEASHLATGS